MRRGGAAAGAGNRADGPTIDEVDWVA
eukprot:SAG31_NODE_27497_length_425_cov_0.840491_1_plen_26_part_10